MNITLNDPPSPKFRPSDVVYRFDTDEKGYKMIIGSVIKTINFEIEKKSKTDWNFEGFFYTMMGEDNPIPENELFKSIPEALGKYSNKNEN